MSDPSRPAPVLITASQVHRELACLAGWTLPEADDPSPAADAGTAVHANLLRPGRVPGPHAAWLGLDEPGARVRFEALYHREVVFAVADPGGVLVAAPVPGTRFVGENLGRAYPASDHAALGATTDVDVGLRGMRLKIGDLKTGRRQLYGGTLPEPNESWQLRTQAVLRWDAAGRPEHVEVSLAWLLHDAAETRSWVREGAGPVGSATLRGWEGVLLDLLRRRWLGEGRGEFGRGPWCLDCSSFDFCPAQRGVLERVASRPLTPADVGALSPAELADLWLDVRCAEEQAAQARAALLRHVESRGVVDLGNGRELVPAAQTVRRVKDLGRLKAEAADRGVPGVAREGATLESIRAAFVVAQVGDTGDADAFLAQMEREGVIARTTSSPFLQERARRGGGSGG